MLRKCLFIVASLCLAYSLIGCTEAQLQDINLMLEEMTGDTHTTQKTASEEKESSEISDSTEIKVIKAVDYTNPITRDFAVKQAKKFPGPRNIQQLCEIYTCLREGWKYVNDPAGSEYFSPASRTIELDLAGDCDDFAILMAAMIKAIGGKARIVLAYTDKGGHAYTEVCLGGKEDAEELAKTIGQRYNTNNVWWRKEPDGTRWLNLDWWAEYPGGPYYKGRRAKIIYP